MSRKPRLLKNHCWKCGTVWHAPPPLFIVFQARTHHRRWCPECQEARRNHLSQFSDVPPGDLVPWWEDQLYRVPVPAPS